MRALLERAQREPEGLAAQEPALLAVFIEKVRVHTLAMTCLASRGSTLPVATGAQKQQTRGACVQVLSAREAVPPAVLSAYRPLLAGLSREPFAEALLPALLRVVKRSPDAMLPVAEAALGMLTLDLSPHAEALMRDLEQQLRHQKESVRCGPHGALFCTSHSSE